MKRYARRLSCWLTLSVVMLVPALAEAAGRSVLRVHLDGPVVESHVDEADITALLFGGGKVHQFHDLVDKVKKAGKDKDIAGIVLIVENPMMGMAQVEELHAALQQFRKGGKKVYAYLDYATNLSYALSSAADQIMLAENSMLDVTGLHAELDFYRNFFEKIGVVADMLHCGDYKTALEPYTRSEPSAENREMTNWLLDGLYAGFVRIIAEGRGLAPEAVKAAIDAAPLSGAEAQQHKLVDLIGGYPEFQQLIEKEFGKDVRIVKKYPADKSLDLDFSNPFTAFQKFSEMFEPKPEGGEAGIALIVIEGGIMTGKSEKSPFGQSAGSSTIRHALETAMADPKIKAVVVRVNSPGGSALASDIMWRSATRLGKSKPLIVSMGNVAGSGGYYVSIPADTIFAESTTLTGSIGVVGGKLVWNKLWEEHIGVTTFEFDRGKHAGLMSMNRTWSPDERQAMTNLLNDIYVQFKERVMASRGPRIKGELEPLAGGRVYTGQQALERGLVDRIGGLSDAIALAGEKAGLSDPKIYALPRPPSPFEVLLQMFGEETPDEWDFPQPDRKAAAALPWQSGPRDELTQLLERVIGARAPEVLRGKLGGLRDLILMQREGASCVMPLYLNIR